MEEMQPHEQQEMGSDEPHWISNFFDIITNPAEAGKRYVHSIIPIISFAVLISALAASVSAFVLDANPDIKETKELRIRAQYEKMQEINPDIYTDAFVDEMVEKSMAFSTIGIIGGSIPIMGISLFVVGGLFYFGQRLFNANEIPYTVITAIVGYGSGIYVIGALVTSLGAYIAGTPDFSLSPSLLVSATDNPNLAQYLQMFSIFSIWEYVAIGLAVAAQVRLPRERAFLIAGIAFVITRLIMGLVLWIGSLAQNLAM